MSRNIYEKKGKTAIRSLAAFLCLLLMFMLGSALAMTEEEWNIQCVNKTIAQTPVYSDISAGETLATLKAGAFVRTISYDARSGLWRVEYLNGTEPAEGYVAARDLIIAIMTMKLPDGSVENLPEALRGNLEGIAAYLNNKYPDRHYYVSGDTLMTGTAPQGSEEPSSEAAEEVEQLPQGNLKAEETEVPSDTDRTPEPVQNEIPTPAPATATPRAEVTTTPTASPTPAPTPVPLPEDQFEVPEALQGLAVIGTNECSVEQDGEMVRVATGSIRFNDDNKKNRMVGYVKPNREGCVYFYAQPSPKSRLLGYLNAGTMVGIIKTGKSFSRVYVDGVVGCIKTNAISYMNIDKMPSSTGVLSINGMVSEDVTVNLLSSNSNGYIVTSLPSGLEMLVWGKKGKYYEVEGNGYHGWVSQTNLTEGRSLEATVEPFAMDHILSEMPGTTRPAAEGGEQVQTQTRNQDRTEVTNTNYNMHRDPYN